MRPSEYLRLDRYEKAFIVAAIDIKQKEEKERAEKTPTKGKKGRRG
jgi:hypothetical protein